VKLRDRKRAPLGAFVCSTRARGKEGTYAGRENARRRNYTKSKEKPEPVAVVRRKKVVYVEKEFDERQGGVVIQRNVCIAGQGERLSNSQLLAQDLCQSK